MHSRPECAALLAADNLTVATIQTPHGPLTIAVRDNHTSRDAISGTIQKRGAWENITHPDDMFSQAEVRAAALMIGRPQRAHPPVFLDVGANIGYFSLIMAHAGYRAVAIEVLPHNRRVIAASLCLNPSLNVHVVGAAIGSPREMGRPCIATTLVRDSGNGYLNCGAAALSADCDNTTSRDAALVDARMLRLWNKFGAVSVRECEHLTVRTLDEVWAAEGHVGSPNSTHRVTHGELGIVDVLKVDVEGKECNVLAGATAILASRPRFMRIEGNEESSRKCVQDAARRHRFDVVSKFAEGRGSDLNLYVWPRP